MPKAGLHLEGVGLQDGKVRLLADFDGADAIVLADRARRLDER